MTPANYPQQQQHPQQQGGPGGPQQAQQMHNGMMRMAVGPPPNGFQPGMQQMANPMMSMGQPPMGVPALGGMTSAMGPIPTQGGIMTPQMQQVRYHSSNPFSRH